MLFGLTACSSTSFFYNRLDTLIAWYVDDYVSLNRSQDRELDTTLEAAIAWHRREELPRYVELLDRMDDMLDGQLTPAQIDAIFDDFNDAAMRLQWKSLDFMLDFGDKISVEQRLEFIESLEEKAAEFREERVTRSDAEYVEDIREQMIDNFEDWLGRLEDEQIVVVDEAIPKFQRLDALWAEDRERWNRDLRGIIADDPPNWTAEIRVVARVRSEERDPVFDAAFDENSRAVRETVRQVLNLRSESQDRKLRRKLRGYRDDFADLSSQQG